MERITTFRPAFDKRSDNPKQDYGIGCMRCFMTLKGEKGATHFVFGTGMYPTNVMEEWAKQGKLVGQPMGRFGGNTEFYFYTHAPMGYDVGYHAYEPQYEDQSVCKQECEFLDGKP